MGHDSRYSQKRAVKASVGKEPSRDRLPWTAGYHGRVRDRWLSRRAVLGHLALLIWVPGCFVAAWWQVTVAMAGNNLGWLYAVEWPAFAVVGTVVWWQLIHDDPDTVGARGLTRARQKAEESQPSDLRRPVRRTDEESAELAAYNDYLANLARSGARKTWRNPSGSRSR